MFALQSFWAFSREKKGYSGVATYVADKYSPIDAQVDCLGSGNADIDREGRWVLPHASLMTSQACCKL